MGPAPAWALDDGYGEYDEDFACCGGCSSHVRADAYNDKLPTGAKVFIWDTKLKTDPADTCLLTFPYDPARNEQVGDRRVRSGRLVGATYPIDHDYDSHCCEQRGQCRLQEEDASGVCQCVKRWGFTGDHCQHSIYEVAAANNSAIFPEATNLTRVNSLLPDLRGYLLDFDHQKAIADWASSNTDPGDSPLLDAFQTGSYRQYSWSASALFVVAAAVVLLSFVLHIVWTSCCFACGCRKRDPGKRQKIYAKYQKILWGLAMSIFFAIAAAAAVWTFLVVNSEVIPLATEIIGIINDTLVANISEFEVRLLSPLDRLITNGYQDSNKHHIRLEDLQDATVNNLASHFFLENQSYGHDSVSEPVFAVVTSLLEYSLLFPTAVDNLTDCANMNITPSALSRMTIGGETSCFRCRPCATTADVVVATVDYWRRNPFRVQMDMLTSQRQLHSFGRSKPSLVPAIQAFLDRTHSSTSSAKAQAHRIAAHLDEIVTQTRQLTIYALLTLLGLGGATLVLGVTGFVHGIVANKRFIARSTCCVAEITVLLAIVLTGVLYVVVWMSHDGIVTLRLLNESMGTFLPSVDTAEDFHLILFDKSLVSAAGMNDTLAFSDTLRVPPLPTPYNDAPDRVNISQLYYLSSLFELEAATDDIPKALVYFFDWSEEFVKSRYELLMTLAFGNSSVHSPYNQTIHQDLLNSTVAAFIDPDSDSEPATESDLIEIQTVFNESWRGVDDAGVRQNEQIAGAWYTLARLYVQKQRLENYITAVHDVIASVHPMLAELINLTAAMEDAEFALKAPVEFVTDTIRMAKINDCSFDGHCRWFRDVVNDLFRVLQQMITHAERATVGCTVSACCFFLGTIFTNGFATRLRRNVVKVYSGR